MNADEARDLRAPTPFAVDPDGRRAWRLDVEGTDGATWTATVNAVDPDAAARQYRRREAGEPDAEVRRVRPTFGPAVVRAAEALEDTPFAIFYRAEPSGRVRFKIAKYADPSAPWHAIPGADVVLYAESAEAVGAFVRGLEAGEALHVGGVEAV